MVLIERPEMMCCKTKKKRMAKLDVKKKGLVLLFKDVNV